MSAQETIEKHFNMNFIDVINILHWKNRKSIKSLSVECGISRDTFSKLAFKYNLKLRTIQEACKLTPTKGEKHWSWGKKRPECSERMKLNNPSFNIDTLTKMAVSKSKHLLKNPLPAELLTISILEKLNVVFEFQKPINRYVIDFFIPLFNLCLEVESNDKWDTTKKKRAAIKKNNLERLGYNVFNMPRVKISDEYILNILDTFNIIG
jgi:very-short-patch-repair endonuclease